MNPTEIEEKVKQLLAGLGGSPDAVAEHLTELGIRGVREQADACPIFCYLQANGIPVTSVDAVCVEGEHWWEWPPEPVTEFINAFDDGAYPDLVEAADE